MRVGYDGDPDRFGSTSAGETGEIELVAGSKSKSCVGLLKTPPNRKDMPVFVAVAFTLIWIWVAESTLVIRAPDGIPVPATAQPTVKQVVDGIPVMIVEPFVV